MDQAFQLFILEVVKRLNLYKDTVQLFGDPEPTICKENELLITVMTSRCPENALRMNSWQKQQITEFHNFLTFWKKENGKGEMDF